MAELATHRDDKSRRFDSMHESAGDTAGAEHDGHHARAGSSNGKREADGKASDAAILRMSQGTGGEQAVGGTGTTTVAHAAAAGDSGVLTADLKTRLGGSDVTVPKGTYVVVKEAKGKDLVCKVYSSFGGQEAILPAASFQPEPALGHRSDPGHTTEPEAYTYQEYTSTLWQGAPKAADVAQGALGDCYLNAAMGAVAAANPKAIMSLFSPQAANQHSYTITLNVSDGRGGFHKHPITVDTNLPTRAQDVQRNAPIYTLMGKGMKQHDVPLWPALLEKAYAQMMGGYDVVGDKGGYSDRAMEALTGVSSHSETIAAKEQDVLAEFKGFQQAGKAVVCGTLDSKQSKAQGGFTGHGDGPLHASFLTDQGEAPEIVPGTLRLADKAGKAKPLHDDGDGKLTGTDGKGSVDYDHGAADATYGSGKGPARAEDLQADYDWRGQLDKSLNVHAWHAYIFEGVTADNKLQFKNPWGVEHPKPMTAGDFKRLFTGINSNQVPKETERKPVKKGIAGH